MALDFLLEINTFLMHCLEMNNFLMVLLPETQDSTATSALLKRTPITLAAVHKMFSELSDLHIGNCSLIH